MAIPEAQLETWSHQGSVQQSCDTYATVKRSLEANDTKYADKSFDVFLQGSYGNDTNIYAESDVDVVIRTDSIYYYDTSALIRKNCRSFTLPLRLLRIRMKTTKTRSCKDSRKALDTIS